MVEPIDTRPDYAYIGSELDLFAHAKNWKTYWAALVTPYLGREVLDVGAGIGSTAQNLRLHTAQRWIELEPDDAMAQRIRGAIREGSLPSSMEVVTGTSRDLAPGDLFDSILYIDVLEHIEHDAEELRHIVQHLKPGGYLVVLAPAHNWLYTPFDKQIGHYRRYSAPTLRAIKPFGMELCRLQYVDSVGMLASLANRLFLKASHPKYSQIQLWDRYMVPISRVIDRLFFGRVGKSVLCVLRRPSAA